MHLYNTLSNYWKNIFSCKVRKIPLDAGFSCPNRDGNISRKGCVFCNDQGSGTGMNKEGLSLREQYSTIRKKLLLKQNSLKFAAYLQSFSNTYCPPDILAKTLSELHDLEDLAVVCIGTRPDCIDHEKVKILKSFPCKEVWLDLGLQSADNNTLKLINRGHKAEDFSHACHMAQKSGIKVCAHVIAGLPGETLEHFLNTINFLNALPVSGIKIHNLYVCQNTALARMWEQGEYVPLQKSEYSQQTALALAWLRPDIVIHRITGDPAPGELLAPDWAGDKMSIINEVRKIMTESSLYQGKLFQRRLDTT
ncbi:MAG: TIGR01212 family radical SAM protein [Desulfonatronovibrio sp. MSAO_Bac4]|nr:MAG: TIGR01212 family radical SAM protein [Desulfonatronovibrio sp. MSAO_Bac4]